MAYISRTKAKKNLHYIEIVEICTVNDHGWAFYTSNNKARRFGYTPTFKKILTREERIK